jgi:hypothetical protein
LSTHRSQGALICGASNLAPAQVNGRILALAIFGMLALNGCGGGASGPTGGNLPQTYSIGGTIDGLSASGLSIAYGNQTVAPATGAATFVFPTPMAAGTAYSVTVQSQPAGQTCLVTNGTGTVGSANVTTIQLSCNANNLSGTASTGSPIAGSAVVLVDSNDKQVTTKTDGTGQYALSTVGLTAPFLVSVVASSASPNGYAAGTTFYSVSDQATPTVINITPLTDLLIRDWYAAQNSPIAMANAFNDPASNSAPTPQEVQLLNTAILDIILPALQQQGSGPGGLDLVSASFAANGQGLDAVLDDIEPITYDSAGTTASITINTTRTTTQSTTVTASAGQLQVATTTIDSASGVTSSNVTTGILPTSSAQAAALSGVQRTLDSLSSVIQSKGAGLQAADLAPFFDGNFLDGGLTASGEWLVIKALAGATINSDIVSRIKSYDGTNDLLGVIPILDVTQNGTRARNRLVYGPPDVGLIFKRESDGSWLLYGNQQQAYANTLYENQVIYDAMGNANPAQYLNLAVTVPTASLTQPCSSPYASSATVFPLATINAAVGGTPVTLTPGGYPLTDISATNQQPYAYGTMACQFEITGGGTIQLSSAELTALVGNTLSFSLDGGAPIAAIARTTPGYTTESLIFVTPSSHALSAVQLGQPLTIQWHPPTTVAVEQVAISVTEAVSVLGGGQDFCTVSVFPFQLTGVSSATITLPNCNNSTPATTTGPLPAVQIAVGIWGSRGEYLGASWAFN